MSSDRQPALPYFHKSLDGRGIDKDRNGYVVVYGDAEKYVFTPQRYKTFEEAQASIIAEKIGL